jgi:hypothetical protein
VPRRPGRPGELPLERTDVSSHNVRRRASRTAGDADGRRDGKRRRRRRSRPKVERTGPALASLLAFEAWRTYHAGASTPPAPATVDGAALGRAYAPVVVATLADGWNAAADALAAGKTVAEAQAALQKTWSDERSKQFAAAVAPHLAAILPEGAEPADDAQRTKTAELWRAFARGLKGGRK